MIDIIGLGSSLLVAKPLVVMPRLVVAYGSDPEPKGKPRRKSRRMPGREPDVAFPGAVNPKGVRLSADLNRAG